MNKPNCPHVRLIWARQEQINTTITPKGPIIIEWAIQYWKLGNLSRKSQISPQTDFSHSMTPCTLKAQEWKQHSGVVFNLFHLLPVNATYPFLWPHFRLDNAFIITRWTCTSRAVIDSGFVPLRRKPLVKQCRRLWGQSTENSAI